MKEQLTVVTDIPTPYRIHLFNQLCETLSNYQMGFEVLFMARTVPIRFWKFDETSCRFPFKIFGGMHPDFGGKVFHFNPGLVLSVLKARPRYVLLGGAWNMPTIVALLVSLWRRSPAV